jgi:hypothetical protein
MREMTTLQAITKRCDQSKATRQGWPPLAIVHPVRLGPDARSSAYKDVMPQMIKHTDAIFSSRHSGAKGHLSLQIITTRRTMTDTHQAQGSRTGRQPPLACNQPVREGPDAGHPIQDPHA